MLPEKRDISSSPPSPQISFILVSITWRETARLRYTEDRLSIPMIDFWATYSQDPISGFALPTSIDHYNNHSVVRLDLCVEVSFQNVGIVDMYRRDMKWSSRSGCGNQYCLEARLKT